MFRPLRRATQRLFGTSASSTSSLQPFSNHSLVTEVRIGISRCGILAATPSQDYAIPEILAGRSLFLLSQTGSGKTLAYVIPLINRLLDSDKQKLYPKSQKPRGIILVPTRELANQILQVVRKFPIHSTALAAGLSYTKEVAALAEGMDILVATPARLLLHIRKGNMTLQDVAITVFDEADILFDPMYENDMNEILAALKPRSPARPEIQIVAVSATYTGAIKDFMSKKFPAIPLPSVSTSSHVPAKSLQQVFIPLYGKSKLSAINEALHERSLAADKKTIVFTNTVKACKWLSKTLLEGGKNVSAVHGRQELKARTQAWHDFVKGSNDILVSTNLASRGLDTQNVGHVILYDFPTTMADYLHRVGRTARAGEDGRVTALVSNKDLEIVKKVRAVSSPAVELRNPSKRVARTLKLAQFDHAMRKFKKRGDDTKRKYLALRRRFGLSKRDWLGPQEKVQEMKAWKDKKKDAKLLKFMRKRGRLGKDDQMPVLPDGVIEKADSQVVNAFSRDPTGALRVVAKRRSRRRTFESSDDQIELGGLAKFRKPKANQM